MQRHIVDRLKDFDNPLRIQQFLRIARTAGPHRASLTLQRRAQERVGLVAFIKIARGQRA